ncbi:Rho GTPase-activating protein 1 [Linum grandiflorum]
MQLSYDTRGNSVPTILLLMQRRLYSQGGLQAEGIFRINGGNSQEDYVRDQLNGGVLPEGVDVHCLAGLIKAWFRELPTGVLDSLQPEGVMQCQTEDECAELVRHLPATESALLDWAINLMADVVEQEYVNRMNARNIAMVFAPNMTQMADPLTALMYAVQVMNFLKTLVTRTLRERQDSIVEPTPASRLGPFHGSGHQSPSLSYSVTREYSETTQSSCNWVQDSSKPDEEDHGEQLSSEIAGETDGSVVETEVSNVDDLKLHQLSASRISIGQSSNSNHVSGDRQPQPYRLKK